MPLAVGIVWVVLASLLPVPGPTASPIGGAMAVTVVNAAAVFVGWEDQGCTCVGDLFHFIFLFWGVGLEGDDKSFSKWLP